MKSHEYPGPLHRGVRPRTSTHDARSIIALDGTSVLLERTGEVHPNSALPYLLISEPPSILVCEQASGLLAHLNRGNCARIAGWQYRIAPVVRRTYRQHRRNKPTESHDVIVSFLGWRLTDRRTHYHYPLDPLVFTGGPIRRLIPAEDEPLKLAALLAWGQDVRQWCRDNGLKVGSGTGSLAVQLLKDPRFYPEARRKVPRQTNERARFHLPGNHYELFVREHTYHEAYYVDMQSAHHNCAAEIVLPNGNGLMARGRYREPPEVIDGDPWAKPYGAKFDSLIGSHGLLLVRLEVSRRATLPASFAPPYMKRPGLKLAYVFTNELPMIRELGGIIEGVEAAWTSYTVDTGLSKYARWALAETLTMTDQRKAWAKPALLAAYGMLAARPTAREFGYATAVSGTPHTYMTAGGPLEALVRKQVKETESPVVNVIHRGMIEAEVRMRALAFARSLHAQGCKVLCVYADSVIIDSRGPVPLIPHPWRIKTPLSRLEFFNPTSFHSVELTRLPGIPLDGQRRISRLQAFRATMAGSRGPGRTPQATAPERSGRENHRTPRVLDRTNSNRREGI